MSAPALYTSSKVYLPWSWRLALLLLALGTFVTALVYVMAPPAGSTFTRYLLFIVPLVFLVPATIASHRLRIYSDSIVLSYVPLLRVTVKFSELKEWSLTNYEYVPTGLLNRGLRFAPTLGVILSNRNGHVLSLSSPKYQKISISLANPTETSEVKDLLVSLVGPSNRA